MSPHEITQLLEPSNLLEPLDLTEQRTGPANPSPRGETGAGAQRLRPRETVGMRPPSGSARRSGFKSILVVAVAVTCFGAGTLLPQLQNFAREALGLGSVGANLSLPAAPLTDAAAKSEASNSPEPTSASSSASQSQPDTPLNAAAAVLPTADSTEGNSSAVAHSSEPSPAAQPAANDVSVGCAGPCKQQPCPPSDANCLEGGTPTRAKPLTNADSSAADPVKAQLARAAAKSQSAESERTDTRTMSRQDERVHLSRPSKRAPQHERADKQAVAKRSTVTVSRSSRGQNANRPSFWGRDSSGDSMPTSSWWQRDRYDDYPRDRSRLRAGRDDDFLMGARWRW
jgi:hypothetical protein